MKKILFASLLYFLAFLNVSAKEFNETKYFKTITSADLKYNITYEITKEEYENNNISLLTVVENTEYKKLTMSTTNGEVSLDLEWKKLPKYRSFDVIALRGENISFITSTISGKQAYNSNNVWNSIYYSNTNGNVKIFNDGFGVSMNLVDTANGYKLSIKSRYNITGSNPKIYGTYQHSQKNITLSQSQKYSINSNGYGKVLLFDNSVKNYFDNMNGIVLEL